jgi:uncharacterized protein YfaT (DUF1175 family)
MTRFPLAVLGGAAAIVLGLLCAKPLHRVPPPVARAARAFIEPTQLIADGYDTATLTIDENSAAPPHIAIEPAHAATVTEVSAAARGWQARIRAGVTPASLTLRVEVAGLPAARVALAIAPDFADSAGDGTPDFLRLDDPDDQQAFRRWFTFLAETQYFQPAERRPAEIADCAALIRYAYREALRAHDGNWATGAHLPLVPGIPSVAKYQYPFTPLGADLFRVKPGGFQPADLTTGAFAQFADAKTLELRGTHFVARDADRAEPGDLLFYRQEGDHMPFHSMIYLGASQIAKDAGRYLVYHTGPDAGGPGEIRRPTLDELRRFPEPDWRPLPDNPRFLGVFRWNILRRIS